ncbi:MAG TPA: periplasmic heavy metal sensor [Acidobacteriota bacterium]|nr:periplasmic heavy metal sensor [Acidobacteriota bacterium]HQM63297.1 periplasmic heavy metal sensor [Acidobacteriota bacterium]
MYPHSQSTTRGTAKGFVIILLAGLLLAASAWALAGPRGPRHGRPGGPGGEGPRPALMERALERLDLTEAQRAQVEPILAGLKAGLEDERERRIEAQDALVQAIRKPSVDTAAVKAAAANIAALERESYLARAKAWSEIYPILTERQAGGLDVLAAGPGRRAGAGTRDRFMDGPGHPLGRAFGRLDLTEAQEDQIRTNFEQKATAVRKLREADQAAHEELRAAIMKPAFDAAAVEAAAAKHAQAHEALALARAETHAALWNILDENQQEMLEKRPERGFRRGR